MQSDLLLGNLPSVPQVAWHEKRTVHAVALAAIRSYSIACLTNSVKQYNVPKYSQPTNLLCHHASSVDVVLSSGDAQGPHAQRVKVCKYRHIHT